MNQRIEKKVGKKILAIFGKDLAIRMLGGVSEVGSVYAADDVCNSLYDDGDPYKGTPICGRLNWHLGYDPYVDETQTVCYEVEDLIRQDRYNYKRIRPEKRRITGKDLINYARKLKYEYKAI